MAHNRDVLEYNPTTDAVLQGFLQSRAISARELVAKVLKGDEVALTRWKARMFEREFGSYDDGESCLDNESWLALQEKEKRSEIQERIKLVIAEIIEIQDKARSSRDWNNLNLSQAPYDLALEIKKMRSFIKDKYPDIIPWLYLADARERLLLLSFLGGVEERVLYSLPEFLSSGILQRVAELESEEKYIDEKIAFMSGGNISAMPDAEAYLQEKAITGNLSALIFLGKQYVKQGEMAKGMVYLRRALDVILKNKCFKLEDEAGQRMFEGMGFDERNSFQERLDRIITYHFLIRHINDYKDNPYFVYHGCLMQIAKQQMAGMQIPREITDALSQLALAQPRLFNRLVETFDSRDKILPLLTEEAKLVVMERKESEKEIGKSARVFGEAFRDTDHPIFSRFDRGTLRHIARDARDPKVHSEEEADKIAEKKMDKPPKPSS